MRVARGFLFVVAALAVAGVGRAQSPPPSTPTVVVRGTIQAYDVESKTLTVSTERGSERFVIGETTRIRERWRAIDASALEHMAGRRVAVRYVDANDARRVESVHVYGGNEVWR